MKGIYHAPSSSQTQTLNHITHCSFLSFISLILSSTPFPALFQSLVTYSFQAGPLLSSLLYDVNLLAQLSLPTPNETADMIQPVSCERETWNMATLKSHRQFLKIQLFYHRDICQDVSFRPAKLQCDRLCVF